MKFQLEHRLPRRLRYAKVYFEAGPTKLFFSLDGTSADWHASIGRKKGIAMTDLEYTRLRAQVPVLETLDDDGEHVLVRDAAGYDELWQKPRWVLNRVHKQRAEE